MGVDPSNFNGPIVDKVQFDKVLGYIEAGKAEGARCVSGGGRQGEKVRFIVYDVIWSLVIPWLLL
jgi:acyl-CoA reductase-like NAD-dependent aldehyde dehydrogenase